MTKKQRRSSRKRQQNKHSYRYNPGELRGDSIASNLSRYGLSLAAALAAAGGRK